MQALLMPAYHMGVPPFKPCCQVLAAPLRLAIENGSKPYPPLPTAELPPVEPELTQLKLAGVLIGLDTGENCPALLPPAAGPLPLAL